MILLCIEIVLLLVFEFAIALYCMRVALVIYRLIHIFLILKIVFRSELFTTYLIQKLHSIDFTYEP